MKQFIRFAVSFAGIALTINCAGQVSENEVRSTVRKPIALMQTTALTWFDHRPCSSCHHQLLPMIVFDLARRRGVAVDQSSLERMMSKTFAGLANLDHAVQGTQIGFDVF